MTNEREKRKLPLKNCQKTFERNEGTYSVYPQTKIEKELLESRYAVLRAQRSTRHTREVFGKIYSKVNDMSTRMTETGRNGRYGKV